MYRSDLNSRDKGGAVAAVIAIHAALLFAFLHLSGKMNLGGPQSVLQTIELREVPPPPPPQRRQQAKPKQKEGGSSPKNIRSEATEVVAPIPRIVTPPVQQIAATQSPRQGAAPTQGASDVRGPGTGAGGVGTGTGSGSGGNGPGGGGDGGYAAPPSLVRGITGRDYPSGVRERWPRGGIIFLRIRVEADGRPSRCDVMRGFGDSAADQWSCALVMQRAYWRPAVDAHGKPVSGWYGYKQVDISR
jgi:protein TonB